MTTVSPCSLFLRSGLIPNSTSNHTPKSFLPYWTYIVIMMRTLSADPSDSVMSLSCFARFASVLRQKERKKMVCPNQVNSMLMTSYTWANLYQQWRIVRFPCSTLLLPWYTSYRAPFANDDKSIVTLPLCNTDPSLSLGGQRVGMSLHKMLKSQLPSVVIYGDLSWVWDWAESLAVASTVKTFPPTDTNMKTRHDKDNALWHSHSCSSRNLENPDMKPSGCIYRQEVGTSDIVITLGNRESRNGLGALNDNIHPAEGST